MQKLITSPKLFTRVATGILALMAGIAAQAQTYSNAVMALSPVAYWPLNETTQPPAPFALSIVATNSGSLGAVGNGIYGAWYQTTNNAWYLTNNIIPTNGIGGPGDQAMWCQEANGQYVVIPRSSGGVYKSNLTLVPPFSIEAWVIPNATSSGTFGIFAEGGSTGNYGGPNTNDPYYGGAGTGYAGVVVGQYNSFFLFDCFATNGTSKGNELDSPTGGTGPIIGKWNHLVCTYDGTTEAMWINNVEVAHKTTPKNNAGVTFAPDMLTPVMIGSGPEVSAQSGEGGITMKGVIDEVAVYNEVLPTSSIANHYAAASNSTYASVVMADNPILYYRFNDSLFSASGGYPSNTFPVATNYGSLGTSANGVYQPGTTPGVSGPPFIGFGSNAAVAINGCFGAVDVGNGAIPSALNPVGKVPFTVVSWFQGNPADAPGRYEDILGHGNNSYRLALGQNCGETRFNPGPGNTELQFFNPQDMITNHAAFNDGNWHMLTGVTDGTNAFMYVDGVLYKSTNSVTGISIAGSGIDLLLGGAPDETIASFNTANTLRNFDGQIAQVAMWDTNLTTAQIQSMYNAAGVPPSFTAEPVGATNNQGVDVTITAGVGGSQPITYQWYQNNAPASGQTNVNLVFTPITTNNIGNYYLVASNIAGVVTSSVVNVFVFGLPTVQQQSPTQMNIFVGSSPTLHVTATGAQPITYQWSVNSTPISGATASSYTVVNVQSNATYTCALSNSVNTASSSAISITALADPTAPFPSAVLADGPVAYYRLDEASGTTAYDYTGGNNATYNQVSLGLPGYDSKNSVQSDPTETAAEFGDFPPNNDYAGNVPPYLNFGAPNGVNVEVSVEAWVTEFLFENGGNGIVAIGYGGGGEQLVLDTGANAAGDVRFFCHTASGGQGTASSAILINGDGLWHHLVGVCDEAGGHVLLYLDGTNVASGTITTNSGLLSSTIPLSIGGRESANNNPISYDYQFIGDIDDVAIYNKALSATDVQSHYLASGFGPTITQLSPASQTVNLGASATFTSMVTGTPPFSYQWTDPNNNVVSTNSTLVLNNVQASSQGNYTLTVTNLYGTASGSVNLQVNLGPPTLVQDLTPPTQTVVLYSGLDTLSYTIVVSGSTPFTYQWYLDGNKLSGVTNSTYTFTALPGTNTYFVTVTNADTATQGGGVPLTSSTVTVIGLQPPQLNPANYADRVMISFPGYTGNPLTNFPALITLNPASIPGLSYGQFQTNGSDLRFTDASGTAMLPFEIDEWDDNGVSTAWVQIPVLNGTNIWAYWGNAHDADVPPASSNVWVDAGYQIVYHMKEGAFPFADSTGQYPATNGVAPAAGPGVVGHAGVFTGTSLITPGPVTLSNQFTTSAWINITNTASDIQTIWANQFGGFGGNGFSWFVDSYQTANRLTHFDSGNGAGSGQDPISPNTTSSGQWHYVVATWDAVNGVATNYLDAAVDGSGTVVKTLGLTNQLDLGSFLDPVFQFNGEIDEARIQGGIANTNWIMTTYLNIADASFVSYSSVNLQPILTIANSPSGIVFTWPTDDGTFVLQSTPSLSPATWTPVTTPAPFITNGVWEQIVQPGPGNKFYRLEGN